MVQATASRWAGIALIGCFAPWLLLRGAHVPWLIPLAAMVEAAVILAIVGSKGPERGERLPGWAWSSALWVAVLFPYFALLRNGQNGVAVLILMVLLIVASDSGAYFAGRSLGRTKLLPRVSPNKTIEGAIGGLAACVAVGLLLRKVLTPDLDPVRMAGLAVIGGGLAQIGDLVNSAFKRMAKVKDSGWIFPGHGGLLDRTCSLVFPVTFAYYYLRP
jgi:CDP-diglyceride synthetase